MSSSTRTPIAHESEFSIAEMRKLSTSELRNNIGEVLALLDEGKGSLLLMTHSKPRAVLVSYEEYCELKEGVKGGALAFLSSRYDQLIASMDAPASRKAVEEAFEAGPEVFRGISLEK